MLLFIQLNSIHVTFLINPQIKLKMTLSFNFYPLKFSETTTSLLGRGVRKSKTLINIICVTILTEFCIHENPRQMQKWLQNELGLNPNFAETT